MFKHLLRAAALIACSMTFSSVAADADTEAVVKQSLRDKLGLDTLAVGPAPFAGFSEVLSEQGIIFVSNDGKYVFQGTVIDIENRVNVTQMSRMRLDEHLWESRIDGMKSLEESMIVFKAKDEKYKVTVFTDITCGYCRKLHAEMDKINDLGITVRYLAYPRSGLYDSNNQYTANYLDTQAVWCSDDQQQAMTDAKARKSVDSKSCKNSVAEHYRFGRKSGVSGTPAIVLDNGMLIPGYKPAEDLAEMLEMLAQG